MNLRFLFLLLFLLLAKAGFSQQFEEQLDAIAEKHHASFPEVGLVVAVSAPEGLVYEKAFGYSDFSFERKTETDHLFRIGSVTKQFTAVAILKLVEEGKLSLSDSLQQFFPDFPYRGHRITIEHLLTHTSGISDYTAKPDWFPQVSKLPKEPLELVAYFQEDSAHFVPGQSFAYNNSGYHLLGCIIEKLTKQEYGAYLQELIFGPLEMTNTFCHGTLRSVKGIARGYETLKGHKYTPEFVHPAQAFSAGNMVSTTTDLRKWYQGLFAGKIIGRDLLEKAIRPYRLQDGSHTQYGYGWQLDSIQGMPVIMHGGYYPGYNCEVLYFPESKVLVTALSNYMPLTNMVKKLGAAASGKPLEEPAFIPLTSKQLRAFEAKYGDENDFWEFMAEGDRLYYSRNGGARYEIRPVTTNKFYSLDWDVYLEFEGLQKAKYERCYLHWNGAKYEYHLN